MKTQVIQKTEAEKIIAIVRGVGPEQCMKVADALYAGGIRLMEVTYDQKTPASFQATADAIAAIAKAYKGRMFVGAGTVTTPELVEMTAKAGAMTPTEVMTAHWAGADFVKLFPVGNLGVSYVKALRAPISHVKLMAVGGVNEGNIADFLAAGICGVGVGGNLANQKWIESGEFDKITETARNMVEIIKNA